VLKGYLMTSPSSIAWLVRRDPLLWSPRTSLGFVRNQPALILRSLHFMALLKSTQGAGRPPESLRGEEHQAAPEVWVSSSLA